MLGVLEDSIFGHILVRFLSFIFFVCVAPPAPTHASSISLDNLQRIVKFESILLPQTHEPNTDCANEISNALYKNSSGVRPRTAESAQILMPIRNGFHGDLPSEQGLLVLTVLSSISPRFNTAAQVNIINSLYETRVGIKPNLGGRVTESVNNRLPKMKMRAKNLVDGNF